MEVPTASVRWELVAHARTSASARLFMHTLKILARHIRT